MFDGILDFDGTLGLLMAAVVGTSLALLLHFRKDIFELLTRHGSRLLPVIGNRNPR